MTPFIATNTRPVCVGYYLKYKQNCLYFCRNKRSVG